MSLRSPRRKALLVALLLALALGLRLAEVERTAYRPINDAASYLALASQIAHTGDYPDGRAPGSGAAGSRGPTAYFPPAFPYLLAAVDLLDGHATPGGAAVGPARIAQAVLGTATVGLVGLVGLEAFGELVGLVALVLAALYPVLIELCGVVVAENLMTVLVLGATWAALRSQRAEHPYRWIALAGALTGLATLSHVNAIVLAPPLAIAAWQAPRPPATRARVAGVAILIAAIAVTLAPWIARDAVELHRFVPVTDEGGVTLVGTYNPASAANRGVPYQWMIFTRIPGEPAQLRHPAQLTEPALSARLERQALHYIARHPTAPLAVLYHNTRRLLELEGSTAWRVSAASIDLPLGVARIGVASFWALCLVALAGLFTRAVRRAPLWLWLIPLLLWLSVALVNGETPRFREAIDPFLILLASGAAASLLSVARRRLAAAPAGQGGAAVAAGPRQLVEMVQRLA
jgi:4-amino-4-deoxy-L-arabinose transferase-like glycosyltransferase